MDAKLIWLFAFVGIYWAYCLFWGVRGAISSRTSTDYFVAGRTIGLWVFVLAATATSFSGWTFVGHPGKILIDGLPYAFASFYALTIPFTGVLFLRRQWVVGRAFEHITPGEMYSTYYGGNGMRLLTVLVAFLFSVPYLGVQLRASGDLFHVLTDGMISIEVGMFALSTIVMIYVASGGLRSVAYVDCAQCVLLALGIVILGGIAISFAGGWGGFTDGLAAYVKQDLASGQKLTPAGHSNIVAMPGTIQAVSSGAEAQGSVWTGMMCLTYMFALMGIQSSPAFSMWCFSNKTSEPFRWQQVVASSIIIGIILFTFTIFQGLGGNILIANGIFESANDKNLVPQLINLLTDSAPWLVGLLAVCALAAMQSTGAAYMSTFSGMVTRDLYKQYVSPDASDSVQKLCGRIFVIVVTVVALFVAAQFTGAIVMLGGLAVAYGFQMYPALMGRVLLSLAHPQRRGLGPYCRPYCRHPDRSHSGRIRASLGRISPHHSQRGLGYLCQLDHCPARLKICLRKQRRTRKPKKTPRFHPGRLWPHRRPKKMGDTGVDPHRLVVPRWIRAFCHRWQHSLFRSQYPGNLGTLWFALAVGLAIPHAAFRHFRHVDARLQSRPLQTHSHRRCDLATQSVF